MFVFLHRHLSPIYFVLPIEYRIILLSLEKYSVYIIINTPTNKTPCQSTPKSYINKLCAQYFTGRRKLALEAMKNEKL